MAQENFSSNYWLGGFHTGGKVHGINWLRGRWTGGTWEKGNFYSVDLSVDWSGSSKNLWSKWSSGVWKSNSQDYAFNSWGLDNEWSIWHGGTWESERYTNQLYTWQGQFTNAVNIYGDLTNYECDTIGKRTIYLPSPRSLWLGGLWLRGDFKGGIFANGAWHSLKWDPAQYAYLDNLFFMFGVPPQNLTNVSIDSNTYTFIDNDNEGQPFTIFLFNDSEFFNIDLKIQYDETLSNFYQGAFVNSIWEGGTVIDGTGDSFNTLFGMAIDTKTTKIQDDSGFYSNTGFLESNSLLHKRRYGLNLIDFEQYYANSVSNNLNQILCLIGTSYYMPNKFDVGGIYSTIWKRGKFQNGVFMYGQWYDYDDQNVIRSSYNTDLNIQNTFNDIQDNTTLPVNFSVFEQGFFYSSIWYNGIWLAKNNTDVLNKISVFSRSQWLTGYWAAAENNATTFSNDRKLTNSEFWKSVWYNGIWEGGQMTMSVWNSFNPYNFDLTINNNTIAAFNTNSDVWSNINENPLGVISNITYYDSNNLPTTDFANFINDVEKVDLFAKQPVEGFDISALVATYSDFTLDADGTNGTHDPGPYDFDLDDSGTSGISYMYLYNNDEYLLNDYSINNNFIRYMGLVDNIASYWKNGTARGVVWNGGTWMTGEFRSYYFENYPTYITDRRTNTQAQFDWFDDNIINISSPTTRIQNGIWQRGLWYAGYFRATSYMLGVNAFKNNILLGLVLDNTTKLLLTDDLVNSQYNNNNADILDLKPNNYASFFLRKTLREADVAYFSMFNGQMLSGIFYDLNKNGTDTPGFGTLAFDDDQTNQPLGASFGKVTYDVTINPDDLGNPNPINPDNGNLSFTTKNTVTTISVDLTSATPYAYDDINISLNYNLTTQQYINMFYYNSQQTVVAATGIDSNYDIRHATTYPNNMPKWTDILPITLAQTRVPSTAQGSGQTEPYYNPAMPVIWIDSGYGQ